MLCPNQRDQDLRSNLGAIEVIHEALTVCYSACPEDLVAEGLYHYTSEEADALISGHHFLRPTKRGEEELSVVKIQFGRRMSTMDILDLIRLSRLLIPGIMEMLHWGIKHREQQPFTTVALGAVTRSGRLVYIDGDPDSPERDLLVLPHRRVWEASTRFLAIDPL